jgi:hypothetical protein
MSWVEAGFIVKSTEIKILLKDLFAIAEQIV